MYCTFALFSGPWSSFCNPPAVFWVNSRTSHFFSLLWIHHGAVLKLKSMMVIVSWLTSAIVTALCGKGTHISSLTFQFLTSARSTSGGGHCLQYVTLIRGFCRQLNHFDWESGVVLLYSIRCSMKWELCRHGQQYFSKEREKEKIESRSKWWILMHIVLLLAHIEYSCAFYSSSLRCSLSSIERIPEWNWA